MPVEYRRISAGVKQVGRYATMILPIDSSIEVQINVEKIRLKIDHLLQNTQCQQLSTSNLSMHLLKC